MMTKLCTILVNRWERISPRVEGVFRRSFEESNVEDDRIKYYHARGFLYKWPVFTAKKSIFPWTVNYVLRNVGKNKIHRDAQYLDCFVALEFTDIGDQMFIMYATTLSPMLWTRFTGISRLKQLKVNNTLFAAARNCFTWRYDQREEHDFRLFNRAQGQSGDRFGEFSSWY